MTRPDAAARAALLRFYDGTLRPGELVSMMSDPGRAMPWRRIARGPATRPLPAAEERLPPLAIRHAGRSWDLVDYLSVNRVAGLLVMKRGRVVLETYELGIGPETQWWSCSLAKSFASTLAGMALAEGYIRSLDDPVTRYAAVGGAYAEVSVRQLLRMASGVAWDETYVDPASDRRQLLDRQLEWQAGAILDHMGRLPRRSPPGTAWAYNTGESYLLGAVVEGATGMNLADYLGDRIWSRIGMEHDATWWEESPGGMTVSGSGMTATLRDYARFGRFVLEGGIVDGRPTLPPGWFAEAGAPYMADGQRVPYGYMWWIPVLPDPDLEDSFQAEGIYGQFLHLNPREELVVVVLSARSKPSMKMRLEIDDDAFFAAVARALR
ncbi:hypothetical protein STAQ_40850 [Allostella sp. ATCC 35155]|nr:hypothetical protein STAQ_40850 [Stella sp. ATCC 35155]